MGNHIRKDIGKGHFIVRNKKRIKSTISTWHDRLNYFREDNYKGFLLLLFILVNLVIFVATAIAVHLLPENNGLTLKEILWRSISYMLDPGNLEQPRSAVGTIVLSIFTIIGMIFFSGGMVAFLSSVITDYLEDLRNGDTAIHYKHFTLFLGWNEHALGLLKTFMQNDRQSPVTDFIVILTKESGWTLREKIMKQLREYQKYHEGTHELRILVRSGDPAEYSSLLVVDYRNADKVFIFLEEKDEDPDFGAERAYFSLMRAYTMRGEKDKVQEKEPDGSVSVVVETLFENTAELINRFPIKNGFRSIETEAFSIVRVLGQQYAGMIPHQGNIMICNVNEVVFYLLDEILQRNEVSAGPKQRVLLMAEAKQEDKVKSLLEETRFNSLWLDSPVIIHDRKELCSKLISNLQGDFQTLFILSDDYLTYSGERHNFELWADFAEALSRKNLSSKGFSSESAAAENADKQIFFEMLDETDAQIMEGFELGHCVITGKLITEHIAEM